MGDGKLLIVGVGSPHGDDRVGWEVVNCLAERALSDCHLQVLRSPLELLNHLDGVGQLHIVDACQPSRSPLPMSHVPGTQFRLYWPDRQIAERQWTNTHDFHIAAVMQLADELKMLPDKVVVWGVVGASFGPGAVSSRDMLEWAEQLAARIQQEIVC